MTGGGGFRIAVGVDAAYDPPVSALIPLRAVADRLGMTEPAVRQAARIGHLWAVAFGEGKNTRYRTTWEAVDAWRLGSHYHGPYRPRSRS